MPDNKGIRQLWGYDLIDSKARNAISSTRSSLENDFQKKTDDTLGTTSKTIPGAINEIKDSVDNLDEKFSVEQTDTKYDMKYNGKTIANIGLTLTEDQIAGGDGSFNIDLTPYQTKTDSSLTTTDKTISGAIKELNTQYKDIANKKADKNDLQLQKSRIDNLTTLTEGSTTGDAELIDARIGMNNKIYPNVGSNIRTLGNILFNDFINEEECYNVIDLSTVSTRVLVSQIANKIVNTTGTKVVINDNEHEMYSYAVIKVTEGEKLKWEGYHVDSSYANIGIVYTKEDDTVVLRDIPSSNVYISTVPHEATKAYLGLQNTTGIKTLVYEVDYKYNKKKIMLTDLEKHISKTMEIIINNMKYAENLWTLGNQTKTSASGKWQYLIIQKTVAEMKMTIGKAYKFIIGDYKVFETSGTYCANVEQYNASNTKITNTYYYLTDDSIEFTIDSNCSYLKFIFCLNVNTELTGEFTAHWNNIALYEKELYDKYGENYKISKDIIDMSNGNDTTAKTYPNYYIDHINEKLTSIRSLDSEVGSNGDSFVFITDCHYVDNACNSNYLIKDIIDNTGVNKVINGGDSFNKLNSKDAVKECLMQSRNKYNYLDEHHYFTAIGNHDYNNPSSSTEADSLALELSANEIYPFSIKQYEDNCIIYNKINYYFDNKTQKIRYFVIGCNKSSQIEQESVSWLLSELKNIADGYSVVLIFHSFADVAKGVISTSWRSKVIVDAIDCYNNKTSYTYVEDGNTYNYSTSKGKVILIMFGHVHADASMTTTTNVPVVCTTCDAYRQEHGTLTRTKGTINEQAFDVVHINTSTRKINLTRIGAGSNREFNY